MVMIEMKNKEYLEIYKDYFMRTTIVLV